jgi:anti-anti-sigma regulatory factor
VQSMRVPMVTVKRMPEPGDRRSRRSFLQEVREFVKGSHRPRLIIDLSRVEPLSPEAIDLLLECVDHAGRVDGEVSVAGASAQAAAVLELTQMTSVLDMFPSVSEATQGCQAHDFEPTTPLRAA